MKIGIISLYYRNYNYGGLLQCYALTNYLKQLGYEVEQVTYDRFVAIHLTSTHPCKPQPSPSLTES